VLIFAVLEWPLQITVQQI